MGRILATIAKERGQGDILPALFKVTQSMARRMIFLTDVAFVVTDEVVVDRIVSPTRVPNVVDLRLDYAVLDVDFLQRKIDVVEYSELVGFFCL